MKKLMLVLMLSALASCGSAQVQESPVTYDIQAANGQTTSLVLEELIACGNMRKDPTAQAPFCKCAVLFAESALQYNNLEDASLARTSALLCKRPRGIIVLYQQALEVYVDVALMQKNCKAACKYIDFMNPFGRLRDKATRVCPEDERCSPHPFLD